MFLERILDEMKQVDDHADAPKNKLEPGYTVVGTLPLALQRLYAVKVHKKKQFESAARKEMSKRLANESVEMSNVSTELPPALLAAKYEGSLVNDMFWGAVRLEFPETIDKQQVALFADWQVAWKDSMPSALDLIDLLCGR